MRFLPGFDGSVLDRQLPGVQKVVVPETGLAVLGVTDRPDQLRYHHAVDCRPDEGSAHPIWQVGVIQVRGVERSRPHQPVEGEMLNSSVPMATMFSVQIVCGVSRNAATLPLHKFYRGL